MINNEMIAVVTLSVMKEIGKSLGNGNFRFQVTIKELPSGEDVNTAIEENLLPTTGKEDSVNNTQELPENMIFRRNRNGRPLDIRKLRSWIAKHFVCRVNKSYDWFALWRVLSDFDYIESGETSIAKFVKQMICWFPDAPHRCSAGEINRYKRGNLGSKPYREWDKNAFRLHRDAKQSMDGFNRLDSLCADLSECLKQEKMTT